MEDLWSILFEDNDPEFSKNFSIILQGRNLLNAGASRYKWVEVEYPGTPRTVSQTGTEESYRLTSSAQTMLQQEMAEKKTLVAGFLRRMRDEQKWCENRAEEIKNQIDKDVNNLIQVINKRQLELDSKINKLWTMKNQEFERKMKFCDELMEYLEKFSLEQKRWGFNEKVLDDKMSIFFQMSFDSKFIDVKYNNIDKHLVDSVSTTGNITIPSYGPYCYAKGLSLEGTTYVTYNFTVQGVDLLHEETQHGGEGISGKITSPSGVTNEIQVMDNHNGSYTLTYTPEEVGYHRISVLLNNDNIKSSPFHLRVTENPDTRVRPVNTIFSCEGSGDGELRDPWGVCTDVFGRIIVTDRKNHRLQIFDSDNNFVLSIGKEGEGPGEFKKPAGVCSQKNKIIVADKDNHRIQMFTLEGEFIRMFGKEGDKCGEFSYPWDIDISTDGKIVVSDTKNHRIQLFNEFGQFLQKYGYEFSPRMWNKMDSPRGVCFTNDGKILITDFNNHKILMYDPRRNTAHVSFGSLGSSTYQLERPQGIAVDNSGRIAVADCNNNRVQIFTSRNKYLWEFGPEIGLNKPQGLCFLSKSRIAVVDLNNRIYIRRV